MNNQLTFAFYSADTSDWLERYIQSNIRVYVEETRLPVIPMYTPKKRSGLSIFLESLDRILIG